MLFRDPGCPCSHLTTFARKARAGCAFRCAGRESDESAPVAKRIRVISDDEPALPSAELARTASASVSENSAGHLRRPGLVLDEIVAARSTDMPWRRCRSGRAMPASLPSASACLDFSPELEFTLPEVPAGESNTTTSGMGGCCCCCCLRLARDAMIPKATCATG